MRPLASRTQLKGAPSLARHFSAGMFGDVLDVFFPDGSFFDFQNKKNSLRGNNLSNIPKHPNFVPRRVTLRISSVEGGQ